MKFLLPLICCLSLASCFHTSVAPVATPGGVPVVIRVPNIRVGQKPTKEQLIAIDERVAKGMPKSPQPQSKDPRIVSTGIIGLYGDMKTKSGERFVGYAPFIVITAAYPEDLVDRAAGLSAAAYYRSAKKCCQLVPSTELVNQPKKKP